MSLIPNEADRNASRELWVGTVRTAMDKGYPVKTVKAKTPKDREKAKQQNYWLSKRSYGFNHENYSLINWSK